MSTRHVTVMLDEAVDLLGVKPGGRYIDATAGGGGHSRRILERAGADGRLLAIDRDPDAVRRLREALREFGDRCQVIQGNFGDLAAIARAQGWDHADGILMDLGMSSDQLETPGRGFSFQNDGPLDMRMDTTRGRTAADLVNELEEPELQEILETYGEVPRARMIARRIVAARRRKPFETTLELSRLLGGGHHSRIHPATRIFQALRIAVNEELDAIAQGLEAAIRLLREGGRLAVISFHSLEDRLVKTTLLRHCGRWESLQQGGRNWIVEKPELRLVSRKAIKPQEQETRRNPRSRSARLRVAERHEGLQATA